MENSEESINIKIEQLLSQSNAFFVIDSAGILQYHEDFLDTDIDADLYAGLFSAVHVYAKELKAGEIQTATLEDKKFVFEEDLESGYLIVMDIDLHMSDDNGTWLLHQIVSRFTDMQNLIADDVQGSLSLETLFSERGKTINWSTIQAIREGAIETQKSLFDTVETLNLTKINLRNRLWVSVRDMISTLVKNQLGLSAMILSIYSREQFNTLFSGRVSVDTMEKLHDRLKSRFIDEMVGLVQETEYLEIDESFCSIFPIMVFEGGMLGVASEDEMLIKRLTHQIERLVSSIERLSKKN
ncbi:MAG: hypothetical protein ACXAB7_01695 [Candidatus Kariarchaeaceae archaeon]|jgi:hypothetical protein